MKREERKTAFKKYRHLYKKLKYVPQNMCYYCGEPKQCHDHVPPLKWVYSLGSEYFENESVDLLLVPSCLECNNLLGDLKLFNPQDRMSNVKTKLKKRYLKYLDEEYWSEDEIEELGRNLQDYIRANSDLKIWAERRLRYPYDVQ